MPSLRITLPVCLLAAAAALAQNQVPTQTQTAAARPAFEVASVRPSRPGSTAHTNVPLDAGYVYGSISPDDARSAAGGYLIVTHQPLWRYIVFAYKLSATQEMSLRFSIYPGVPKSGAPLWVTGSFEASAAAYDIEARAPADTSIDGLRLMMQTLLADRLRLVVHTETADAPVFTLVLARPGITGPSLRSHPTSDACSTPPSSQPAAPAPSPAVMSSNLPPLCGVIAHVPNSAPGQHFGGRAVPLTLLATTVPTMTGLAAMPRPVVDQTGLAGLYDFTLNWIHDPSGDDAIADNIANFRDALKSQLGLELKNSHAPMTILIVDHIERPSEN